MKKLLVFFVLALVVVMAACTTMNITAPIKLSDGTIVNAQVKVSRPIFANANFSYNPVAGNIDFTVDTSNQLNGFLTTLNNMALTMTAAYAKTQGVPIPTVQIPTAAPPVTTLPLTAVTSEATK